jgi:hypothetical protein
MPNLILSVTDNYNYFQLARFFKTLKTSGYNGHMCLFVGPNTGVRTMARLKKLGIEIIPFKGDFPFLEHPHPDNVKNLPFPIHVYNFRFYLYHDYLLRQGHRFKNVMLTDIRDVVFQKDPFDFDLMESINVAMENPSIKLGQCAYNSKWMLAGYDEATLQQFAGEVISCSGTTFAPIQLMKNYLLKMLESIQKIKDAYHCGDQAVHNVLLHSHQLQPVQKLGNDTGPVLTLGSEPDYGVTPDGYVTNKSGKLVNIVHQYDRHPRLNRLFNDKAFPIPMQRWFMKRFYKYMP